MALGEKLAKISQELQTSKAEAEKNAKDKELEPIRAKIKELEDQKYQLGLVKGSLELKSGEKTGKGMREYSAETKEQTRKESQKIDTLIGQNKEVLQSVGIENRDQLAENPEFAGEEEVVSYKKSAVQSEELKMSDFELQKKLQALGIDINAENFSYDFAEDAVGERLKTLEKEIVQEKLKTPEGRESTIGMAMKSLENSLPEISIYRDKETRKDTIYVGGTGFNSIEETLSKTKSSPENIKEYQAMYGEDITQEAIKRIHEQRIKKKILDSDERGENIFSLQRQIKKASPEEAENARKLMGDFEKVQNEFRMIVKQKSEELKRKDIRFDSVHPYHDGSGEYEDLIKLLRDKEDIPKLTSALDNPSIFPSEYDFVKLQDLIRSRIASVLKFTESVKSLQTKEDVRDYYVSSRGAVDEVSHDVYNATPYNVRFELVAKTGGYSNDRSTTAAKDALEKCQTYAEAKEYLDKKAKILLDVVPITLRKIEIIMTAQKKLAELSREMEKEKFDVRGGIQKTTESVISNLGRAKESALNLMTQLTKLEAELPKENVVLEGSRIEVPAIIKKLEELEQNTGNEEGKLKDLWDKIYKHEGNKPKLFGKDKWEQELRDLEKEKEDLKEKIRKMQNEEKFDLSKKSRFYISTERYGPEEIEKLVNGQKFEGSSDKVFENLKDRLNEIINRKIPESIMKPYREYQELTKQLQ